jgi:hypothetical protein
MKLNKRTHSHSQRGAALVETALVVGVILVMVLGAVQVGVIGYLQMTADAASFVNARQSTIGVASGSAADATASIFPQITSSNITTTVVPAPSATVYVDYGYNDSSSSIRTSSVDNRHGGAALMQPSGLQSTVSKSSVATILGIPIGVSGSMIEPQWLENGVHYDVANADYGSSTASDFQVDYFKNGENTPPYYVGFNLMEHCQDAMPWAPSQTDCVTIGTATPDFLALGMAEHLDASNWGIPTQGISGQWGPSATPVTATASTFVQMRCHQAAFAQVANFLASNPDLGTIMSTYFPGSKPVNVVHELRADGTGEPIFETMFKGDDGQPVPSFDSATISAIINIYSWDREVVQGYPPATYTGVGTYPLYPWEGCTT